MRKCKRRQEGGNDHFIHKPHNRTQLSIVTSQTGGCGWGGGGTHRLRCCPQPNAHRQVVHLCKHCFELSPTLHTSLTIRIPSFVPTPVYSHTVQPYTSTFSHHLHCTYHTLQCFNFVETGLALCALKMLSGTVHLSHSITYFLPYGLPPSLPLPSLHPSHTCIDRAVCFPLPTSSLPLSPPSLSPPSPPPLPLSPPPLPSHTCNDIELRAHSSFATDVVVTPVLALVHAVNNLIDLHLRRGVGWGWGGVGGARPEHNGTYPCTYDVRMYVYIHHTVHSIEQHYSMYPTCIL